MPPLFVPADFAVPTRLIGPGFRLVPLGADHNVDDYSAWTSSMDHIHATPGFEGHPWPHEMTPDENLDDLRRHAEDFAARQGFTYTAIEGDSEVIGCVYIYPADAAGCDAHVRSWVRADRAQLDETLYRAVRDWLDQAWPFRAVDYAAR